jgi:hypothetical protein
VTDVGFGHLGRAAGGGGTTPGQPVFTEDFAADDLAVTWDVQSGAPAIAGGVLVPTSNAQTIVTPKASALAALKNYVCKALITPGAAGRQYHGVVMKRIDANNNVRAVLDSDSNNLVLSQTVGGSGTDVNSVNIANVRRALYVLCGIFGRAAWAAAFTTDPETDLSGYLGMTAGAVDAGFRGVADPPGLRLFSLDNTQGQVDDFAVWDARDHPFDL